MSFIPYAFQRDHEYCNLFAQTIFVLPVLLSTKELKSIEVQQSLFEVDQKAEILYLCCFERLSFGAVNAGFSRSNMSVVVSKQSFYYSIYFFVCFLLQEHFYLSKIQVAVCWLCNCFLLADKF